MTKDYITTREAADKWDISDRRVRTLCSQGRIPGVNKDGRSYKIPATVVKPVDLRKSKKTNKTRLLKWDNDTIGLISESGTVDFINPEYNRVVSLYTGGEKSWSPEQLTQFLSERLVSRERRDIERILFRLGLSYYDVTTISSITRGIHPKDLLWIANDESERMEDIITEVFDSVFRQRIDLIGESLDSPEGYNIKRYGVFNPPGDIEGVYGIYKQRLNPLSTDIESELAVFLLAQKLGVKCCPVYRVDYDTIFSVFLYDFSKEYIVHFRRLFNGVTRSDNEYMNLLCVRSQYANDFARMILLDFITRQDDRHLSNMAIKISGQQETFYPLYDNGRSLFYEDTEQTVLLAVDDPIKYATGFGVSGSYWDYVMGIAKQRKGLEGLINLEISKEEITEILEISEFTGYRLTGALEWITKTMQMVRELY